MLFILESESESLLLTTKWLIKLTSKLIALGGYGTQCRGRWSQETSCVGQTWGSGLELKDINLVLGKSLHLNNKFVSSWALGWGSSFLWEKPGVFLWFIFILPIFTGDLTAQKPWIAYQKQKQRTLEEYAHTGPHGITKGKVLRVILDRNLYNIWGNNLQWVRVQITEGKDLRDLQINSSSVKR